MTNAEPAPLGLRVPLDADEATLALLTRLEGYDLSREVKTTALRLQWEETKGAEVEERAKQYFALWILDPDHDHVADFEVAELWLSMLHYTTDYVTFCEIFFGGVLDYARGVVDESGQQRYRTETLLTRAFGQTRGRDHVRPPPVPPLSPIARTLGQGFTPARETQLAVQKLAEDDRSET